MEALQQRWLHLDARIEEVAFVQEVRLPLLVLGQLDSAGDVGRHAEAMQTVLTTLIETADDVGIAAHQRTIRFHAAQLDKKWE